jgi:hypothetical protein
MIEISSAEALWILEAYRRMNSQLHVSGTISKESISLPGVIWWTMPEESKFSIAVADMDREQKREWKLSLEGARISFDPVASSGVPSGEVWLSFLTIDWPETGTSLLIGERFIKSS